MFACTRTKNIVYKEFLKDGLNRLTSKNFKNFVKLIFFLTSFSEFIFVVGSLVIGICGI